MSDVLDGAKKVIGGFLAILAFLAVMWLVAILFTPGPHNGNFLATAGLGLRTTFSGLVTFLKSL